MATNYIFFQQCGFTAMGQTCFLSSNPSFVQNKGNDVATRIRCEATQELGGLLEQTVCDLRTALAPPSASSGGAVKEKRKPPRTENSRRWEEQSKPGTHTC